MSATVSAGRRPGYSEVSFPERPSDDVRQALKASGYRWAPSTSVWYGLTSRLPAVVAPSGVEAAPAPVLTWRDGHAATVPPAPAAPADALAALAAQVAALQAQIAALAGAPVAAPATVAAPVAPAPAVAPARPAAPAPVARRAAAPKASARMIGAAPDAGVWS